MHIVSHFAYLDAGTGSLIVQSLIGIVAGIAVFWRKLLASVKMKFGSAFKKSADSEKTASAKTTDK
jgi:hypothetical protein